MHLTKTRRAVSRSERTEAGVALPQSNKNTLEMTEGRERGMMADEREQHLPPWQPFVLFDVEDGSSSRRVSPGVLLYPTSKASPGCTSAGPNYTISHGTKWTASLQSFTHLAIFRQKVKPGGEHFEREWEATGTKEPL